MQTLRVGTRCSSIIMTLRILTCAADAFLFLPMLCTGNLRAPFLPSQDAESLWQDPKSGRYYAFLKDRSGDNRSRLVVHSDDFEHWSEPQWIFTPDYGDHRGTNFYNQSVFTMAGSTLGFLNVYDLTTQTAWLELIESSDNTNWRRMPSRPCCWSQALQVATTLAALGWDWQSRFSWETNTVITTTLDGYDVRPQAKRRR